MMNKWYRVLVLSLHIRIVPLQVKKEYSTFLELTDGTRTPKRSTSGYAFKDLKEAQAFALDTIQRKIMSLNTVINSLISDEETIRNME